MKYRIIFLITSIVLLAACEDMHEKTRKYWGERVYPAKYDTIFGKIGYERVEIDLVRAGRVPSDQINLGKAKKTVIRFDNQEIVKDGLVSWLNMTGLTQSRIYRFLITTQDDYGNESVPQEIAMIPFTKGDMDALVVTSPRLLVSPSSCIVDWPSGINSMILNCHGFTYSYVDREGKTVTGANPTTPYRFFVGNLDMGKAYTVKMKYKVRPLVNGVAIMDTLLLDRDLIINVPTGSGTFIPVERDVLIANGLTQFNFEAASQFKKLVYPLHANSLQDLFYFPNIEEVDFTGEGLTMKTYIYNRNNVSSTVGGGSFLPFVAKIAAIGDTQILKDLLEAGTIKKVKYIPNSLGLDALLAPYVSKGVVELVQTPDDVLIPYNFRVDGNVQTGDFNIVVTQNPSDAPAGTGLQYVYKMIPKGKSASFILALPPEYKYNANEYPYIKFRVYSPSANDLSGADRNFNQIWLRLMTSIWGSFPGESAYGQEESSNPRPTATIAESEMQKWTEYSRSTSDMLTRHTRVIVFNIGNEAGNVPSKDLTFFFSNIRFSKTP